MAHQVVPLLPHECPDNPAGIFQNFVNFAQMASGRGQKFHPNHQDGHQGFPSIIKSPGGVLVLYHILHDWWWCSKCAGLLGLERVFTCLCAPTGHLDAGACKIEMGVMDSASKIYRFGSQDLT